MLRALGALKRGVGSSVLGPVQRGPRRPGRPGAGAPFWGCSPLLGLVLLWLVALLLWHRNSGAGPSTEGETPPDLSGTGSGSEASDESATPASTLRPPLSVALSGGSKAWRGAGEGDGKGGGEEEDAEVEGDAVEGFQSQHFAGQSWTKQKAGAADENEEDGDAHTESLSRRSHSAVDVEREESEEDQDLKSGTSVGSRGRGASLAGHGGADDDEDRTGDEAEDDPALGVRDAWQRERRRGGTGRGQWRHAEGAQGGDDGQGGSGGTGDGIGGEAADEEQEEGDESGAVGQRMRRRRRGRIGWHQAGRGDEDVEEERAGNGRGAGGAQVDEDRNTIGRGRRRWGERAGAQGEEEDESEREGETEDVQGMRQAGQDRGEVEDEERPRERVSTGLHAAVDAEAQLAVEEAEAAESEAEDQEERRRAAALRAKQEAEREQEQQMLVARKRAEEEAARKFYGHSSSEEDVQVDENEEGQAQEGLDSLSIPGTMVKGANVLRFERALKCLSEGRWAYNATPRWLPWDLNPLNHALQPNYRSCDLLFSQRKGGVYGARAERARLAGGAHWKVRRELLYEWRTASTECPFVAFSRASMCRAVAQRNMVIVGDAFSLDMHDAMINHLLTPRTKRMAGWIGDAWANATEGACFVKGHQMCADVSLTPGRQRLSARPTQRQGRRLMALKEPYSAEGSRGASTHGRMGGRNRAARSVDSRAWRRRLQETSWGQKRELIQQPVRWVGKTGSEGLRRETQVLQAQYRSAFGSGQQLRARELGKEDPATASVSRAQQLAGEDEEDAEDGGDTGVGAQAGGSAGHSRMHLGAATGFRNGGAYVLRQASGDGSGSARAGAATASFARLGSEFSRTGSVRASSTAGDPGDAQQHFGRGAHIQGSADGASDLGKHTGSKKQRGAVVKGTFHAGSAGASSGKAGRAARVGRTSAAAGRDRADRGQGAELSLRGGFNLRVVLNPFLTPDSGRLTRYNNRWLRKLKRWNTDILILTRTALFKDKRMMLQEVRDTLEAVRELYPDMLIIWRNSPAGHPHCERFTRPLKKRPQAEIAARGEIPASWGQHAEINAAVRPLLKEYGVVYMDVDAATSLRPDGHHLKLDGTIDCRHYCMPGPLDQWVDLLHNILLLLNHFAEPEAEPTAEAGGDQPSLTGEADSSDDAQQGAVDESDEGPREGAVAVEARPRKGKPLTGEEEGEEEQEGEEGGAAQTVHSWADQHASATESGAAHTSAEDDEAEVEPAHPGGLGSSGSTPGSALTLEPPADGGKKGGLFSGNLWGLFGLERSPPADPEPLQLQGEEAETSGTLPTEHTGAESDSVNETEPATVDGQDGDSQSEDSPANVPVAIPRESNVEAHPGPVAGAVPSGGSARASDLEDPESKATLEAEAEAEAAAVAAASENREEEAAAEQALQSKADAEREMVDEILGEDAKEAARKEAEAEARLKGTGKRKHSPGTGADSGVDLDPSHEGEGMLDDVEETPAVDSRSTAAATAELAGDYTDEEEEAGVAFVAGAVQRQSQGHKGQWADARGVSSPGAATAGQGGAGKGTGVDVTKEGGQAVPGADAAQKADGKGKTGKTREAAPAHPNTTVPVCTDYKRKCIPGTHVSGRQVATLEKDLACIAGGGKWVPYNVPRLIPWDKNPHRNAANPNYGTCDLIHEKTSNGVYGAKAEKARAKGAAAWLVRPALKYTYKASRFCPQLLGFDRGDFCQQIGQRNIVVIGDATQLSLHDVFLNHLVTLKTSKQAGRMGDAWPSKGQPSCASSAHILCGDLVPGGFTFRVVHDDLLTGDAKAEDSQQWLERLRTWNASIIILNKGLAKQSNKEFVESLKHTLKQLRRVTPEALVVWRNTWRGHTNCGNASGPLPSPPPLSASDLSPWDHIFEQNKLARAVAKEFGVVYLDVDTPLSMRPDGHLQVAAGVFDCYFYCIPGPLDHIVRVFYNIIKLLNRHGVSRQ